MGIIGIIRFQRAENLPAFSNLTVFRFQCTHTYTRTNISKKFQRHTNVKNRKTVDIISDEQRETIETLAKKGCTMSEVGTALGLSQNQLSQILEDESHLFNVIYWSAKVEYAQRIRDFAMDIAEHNEDAAVRAKMVEFLAKENSEAFENKRLTATLTSRN